MEDAKYLFLLRSNIRQRVHSPDERMYNMNSVLLLVYYARYSIFLTYGMYLP